MVQGNVLAITDDVVVPLNEVLKAVSKVKKDAVEDINYFIITQASSLSTIFFRIYRFISL